jgi:glycine dehydrogenase subunit 1
LRAAIYLAELGPQGLRETAELCLQKAHYAKQQLTTRGRLSLAFDQPTFKEFVIRDQDGRVADLLAQASSAGYLAGVPLGQWYPNLADCFLVCVTEKRVKAEMDGLAASLCSRGESGGSSHGTRLAGVNK